MSETFDFACTVYYVPLYEKNTYSKSKLESVKNYSIKSDYTLIDSLMKHVLADEYSFTLGGELTFDEKKELRITSNNLEIDNSDDIHFTIIRIKSKDIYSARNFYKELQYYVNKNLGLSYNLYSINIVHVHQDSNLFDEEDIKEPSSD